MRIIEILEQNRHFITNALCGYHSLKIDDMVIVIGRWRHYELTIHNDNELVYISGDGHYIEHFIIKIDYDDKKMHIVFMNNNVPHFKEKWQLILERIFLKSNSDFKKVLNELEDLRNLMEF